MINFNLNLIGYEICFKLNFVIGDDINFECCKVEIKNLLENKNGFGSINFNVFKYLVRSFWFNGLFN